MSPDSLTLAEGAQLTALWHAWHTARQEKCFETADTLRAELTAWGCVPPEFRKWHPVFEEPAHRQARLQGRA